MLHQAANDHVTNVVHIRAAVEDDVPIRVSMVANGLVHSLVADDAGMEDECVPRASEPDIEGVCSVCARVGSQR